VYVVRDVLDSITFYYGDLIIYSKSCNVAFNICLWFLLLLDMWPVMLNYHSLSENRLIDMQNVEALLWESFEGITHKKQNKYGKSALFSHHHRK